MKALLYKDACVIWGQLKILVLLVALFCLMPQLRLNGFFLIYAGIMFPTTLMSFDERSKWDTLAGMLPYADRERVLSRYVSGWAALAFGAVMCLLGYTIQGRGLGLAEVTGLIWLVALALGIQAVSFPILFRVGVEKGRICIWLIYVAAAILMAVLSNLGFPFHSALGVSALGSAGRRGALPAVRAGGGADDGEAGGVIRYNESRCNHEKSLPRGGRWTRSGRMRATCRK